MESELFAGENDGIEDALLALVEEGLLHLGFSEKEGGFIYWPTPRGIEELGMEPPERHPVSF